MSIFHSAYRYYSCFSWPPRNISLKYCKSTITYKSSVWIENGIILFAYTTRLLWCILYMLVVYLSHSVPCKKWVFNVNLLKQICMPSSFPTSFQVFLRNYHNIAVKISLNTSQNLLFSVRILFCFTIFIHLLFLPAYTHTHTHAHAGTQTHKLSPRHT